MASVRRRGKSFTGYWRLPDGSQRSKGGFLTDTEALAHAIAEERIANPPEPVMLHRSEVRGRITVAAYSRQWLDTQTLEPNTLGVYDSSLRRIVARLGGKAVAEVEPDDIRRLVQHLKREGLKDATVHHVLTVAWLLFEAASRAKLREDNPCDGVKHRIKDQSEMIIATRAQAKAIEEAISPRFALLVRTLFATGMRWSEAIAVKGTDVEQRGKVWVLKIRRTANETWVRGEDGGRGHVWIYTKDYGKSAKSIRDITIPAALAGELMAFGDSPCFTSSRGGHLRRADFRSRHWKPACKAVGIPALRVHDTRHSHASWLANDPRVPLAAVRDRLGHSSLSVTSKYIHVMGDDDPCLTALAA